MIGRNLNQSGNAMMVVVIGLILLSGTCIELMTGGVSQIPNLIKTYRIKATRDSLELSLLNRTSFPGVYRSSLHPNVIAGGENEDLLVCVVGVPGKLCMANTVYPVALYSWETNSKTLLTSLVKIAGPSETLVPLAQPVSYDLKGNICLSVGASADCAFLDVEVSFKATCPAGAISCGTAEKFQISYSIRGSSLASSVGNTIVAVKDRVALEVNINEILPPKVGAAVTLTQITSKIGTSNVTTEISSTLAIIARAGVTNATEATNLANLLLQMGITDPVMINAIALSKWRDQTNIQAFMDIFTQKNITNPIIITALANQVNLNAAWFADIANAITIAGITDQAVANDISRFSIKDPVLAAAFAIPKDPAVLNLIKTSANWLDSGYVNAFASAMYVAGITTAPSGALAAVIRSGNLDPVKIPLVLNSIAGTGTTNQTYMNSIAMNWITDTSVAIQAVNTFNAIGATDGRLSDTILAGRIFDVATAQNFYNVIGAAGSAVHSYSYLNTGLTSLTTFNNFVTATASAGIGHDYGKISTIANLVKTNNLTTVPEMQALINSTYPSGTVATAPTEGSTTITDSTTTSTTTTTTTIGTSTTSSTVIALETISGTCTVDCTASSF